MKRDPAQILRAYEDANESPALPQRAHPPSVILSGVESQRDETESNFCRVEISQRAAK